MIEDEKAGFTGPDDGDLHLLNYNDDSAPILSVCNLLSCETCDVDTGWEEIRLRLGLDIGHDDENCVADGNEASHDPIIVLKALWRSKE